MMNIALSYDHRIVDGREAIVELWRSMMAGFAGVVQLVANGTAEEAHYGCVLGHLMNNSYRLGKEVPFNRKAGGFADNADANEHFGRLHDVMSDGVGLPEDGSKYVVGPWLTYNPETERHTGDHAEAANALLKDRNRKGFEIPAAKKV